MWSKHGSCFSTSASDLELQFFQAASASGKPRGLRWKAIEWEPAVEFARERASGRLAALVGVTIQFEAVEGSDMEGLPAVGNLRNASAVFFFHDRTLAHHSARRCSTSIPMKRWPTSAQSKYETACRQRR